MAPCSTSNLFLLYICCNKEHSSPPPPPHWPPSPAPVVAKAKSQHVDAPPSLSFCLNFKERVLCAIAAAPWAWKGPALPHGWGDTCLLPLCWPRPSWGRGSRQCSLSVSNTELRVGGHFMMPQDLRLAEVGLGWAESSDLGRGATCGDVWGRNSTSLSLWWQHNCQTL